MRLARCSVVQYASQITHGGQFVIEMFRPRLPSCAATVGPQWRQKAWRSSTARRSKSPLPLQFLVDLSICREQNNLGATWRVYTTSTVTLAVVAGASKYVHFDLFNHFDPIQLERVLSCIDLCVRSSSLFYDICAFPRIFFFFIVIARLLICFAPQLICFLVGSFVRCQILLFTFQGQSSRSKPSPWR